jgi:hypothetical protein
MDANNKGGVKISILKVLSKTRASDKNCHNIRFRTQWPRGLMRRSAAAWLLESRVRIPLGAWMFASCVYMLCCPM